MNDYAIHIDFPLHFRLDRHRPHIQLALLDWIFHFHRSAEPASVSRPLHPFGAVTML